MAHGERGDLRGPGCRAPLLKANSRAVARRRDQQRTGRRGEVYEYCVGQAVGGVGIVAIDGASATRVAELANRRAARSVSPAAAPSMLVVIACTPHRLPCRLDRDFCFRSGRTVFHRRLQASRRSRHPCPRPFRHPRLHRQRPPPRPPRPRRLLRPLRPRSSCHAGRPGPPRIDCRRRSSPGWEPSTHAAAAWL